MSRVLRDTGMAFPPPAWRRPLLALMLALLLLGLLFHDSLLAMVRIWERSETFAHAFLVPPISLWLIWRRRHELALLQARPAPLLLLPMLVLGLGWLLGELVSSNAATQLMVVSMIVLLVPTLLGVELSKRIAFPLAFLFFCVPIGEFMLPVLMQYTADFTVAALRLTGIPVYREGLQFIIPSGQWSVVEACSGVRYLIASVMVGSLFAYLNYRSYKRRLLFIGFAIVLPILANWIRAYGIVLLGHVSGNTLAVGADHLIYGWVFFGVVMLAMFMLGARWHEPESAQAPTARPVVQGGGGARYPMWVALLAMVVVSLPILVLRQLDADADAPRGVSLDAPAIAGWTRSAETLSDWAPVYANPAAQLQAVYVQGGQRIGLYLGYYRQQNHQSKLISSDNVIVASGDPHWARVASSGTVLRLAGAELPVQGVQLKRADAPPGTVGRLLVLRYFWVQGEWSSSEVYAKLHTAASRLLGRGDDSAVVMIYAAAGERDATGAEQSMRDFVQQHWSAIETSLQQARGTPP